MLNSLLEQVKRAIFDDPHNDYREDNRPGGLIDQLSGLFGQHGAQPGAGQPGTIENPLPASQDPYGDPADQFPNGGQGVGGGQYGNVRPASEDPYGDPADGVPQQFPGIRPASEDPYGDPADQEPRR